MPNFWYTQLSNLADTRSKSVDVSHFYTRFMCVKVRVVHALSDSKKKSELEAQTVIHASCGFFCVCLFCFFTFPWPHCIVSPVPVVVASSSR